MLVMWLSSVVVLNIHSTRVVTQIDWLHGSWLSLVIGGCLQNHVVKSANPASAATARRHSCNVAADTHVGSPPRRSVASLGVKT
jgi:hypothetical protein